MNALRLSTLSLILATAVITLGYVDYASAGKPKCPGDHPKCNKGDDDNEEPPVTSGEYAAALTSGGFIFTPKPVTPNSQGNSLYSDVDVPLTMIRGSDNMAWGNVFADCAGLLSKVTDANTFTVKGGNWHINGGAGSEIRIRFKEVDFKTRGVDIDFDLIGDKGIDGSGIPVPVLPECDNTPSDFTLNKFSIFGQAKKGLKAPSCNEQGFLQVDSVLRIERTDC